LGFQRILAARLAAQGWRISATSRSASGAGRSAPWIRRPCVRWNIAVAVIGI
jgi:hypothetical protein